VLAVRARRAGAAAVDVGLVAVLDAVGARRRAVAARADAPLAIAPDDAALVVATRQAVGPAAVDVGLAAVLAAVRARRRDARPRLTDAALAIGRADAALLVPARRARAAAVHVRFVPVLHAVGAARRLAEAPLADAALAVAPHAAPVADGALLRTEPAAVDVGLGAVLEAVEAGRGHAVDRRVERRLEHVDPRRVDGSRHLRRPELVDAAPRCEHEGEERDGDGSEGGRGPSLSHASSIREAGSTLHPPVAR
jgi:hypothetical protein